jgi:hypothetical protein
MADDCKVVICCQEIMNVNIEAIGSLSQITRPCPIEYKSMKAQHQQVQQDRRLTEFIKEGEVILKHGKQYELTDMAVTSDNKLLLCNLKSTCVYMALLIHSQSYNS